MTETVLFRKINKYAIENRSAALSFIPAIFDQNETMAASKAEKTKVPRPVNCFLVFRLEKQGEITAMCPGANHRDISKILAKWWKELPEQEKEQYRERARLAKIEHTRMYVRRQVWHY